MTDVEILFGQLMRERRLRIGLTQAQLIEEMARRGFVWSTTQASRTETGGRPVSLGEAVAVAEILSIPLGDMLGASPLPEDTALREAHRRGFDECAARVRAALGGAS